MRKRVFIPTIGLLNVGKRIFIYCHCCTGMFSFTVITCLRAGWATIPIP